MKISYIGHSTVLLEDGAFCILIYPFFSSRFSFLKRRLQSSMPPEKLPEIDLVLISYTHPNHCDYDALDKIRRSAKIIMPKRFALKVRHMGFGVTELDNGDSTNAGNFKITAVPAQHQGKCAGYMIEGAKTIYFAGDTFLISLMKKLGKIYNIDVAFLPIGGNRFFGKKMLMDPKYAVSASLDIKAGMVIPIQYGTFGNIPFVFNMEKDASGFIDQINDDNLRNRVEVLDVGKSGYMIE